jgi:8-oxo-dGTP pyrophosphatase MutT (NUDIX family)
VSAVQTALLRRSGNASEVLVTRTRAASFELPKGGIEWDELPGEAAVRELREESGVDGDLRVDDVLGHVEYFVGSSSDRHLKRILLGAGGRISEITWRQFVELLEAGQWYE